MIQANNTDILLHARISYLLQWKQKTELFGYMFTVYSLHNKNMCRCYLILWLFTSFMFFVAIFVEKHFPFDQIRITENTSNFLFKYLIRFYMYTRTSNTWHPTTAATIKTKWMNERKTVIERRLNKCMKHFYWCSLTAILLLILAEHKIRMKMIAKNVYYLHTHFIFVTVPMNTNYKLT